MQQSNESHAPQLLSLHSRSRNPNYWAYMLQLQKLTHPRACALQQEKPWQWEAHAPQQRVAQLTMRESPRASTKTLVQQQQKKSRKLPSLAQRTQHVWVPIAFQLHQYAHFGSSLLATLASLVHSVPRTSHRVFAHPAHSCWIILPSLPFQYQLVCHFPRSRLSVTSLTTYCPIRGSPSTVLLWRTRLYLSV